MEKLDQLAPELQEKFKVYCEAREWTPLIEREDSDRFAIYFISPEPVVEKIVRGSSLEMAVKKATE